MYAWQLAKAQHTAERAGKHRFVSMNSQSTALDLLDHRQQLLILRSEVVQQHPMPGADRPCEIARRASADAAGCGGFDRGDDLPATE